MLRLITQDRLDDARARAEYWHDAAGRERQAAERWEARYDALLEKYHDLVNRPAPSPFPTQEAPATPDSILGQKTRSALKIAGSGQSRSARDAMLAEALRLHTEGAKDENIASALIRGEPVLTE